MTSRVLVAGVGMVPFATPSRAAAYDVLAEGAIRAAVADAGIDLAVVQQVYAGYVYGDSTSGQAALYGVEMTDVPVVNVNNNCSTGSSALYLARQAVAHGAAQCVLVFGFEQMQRGALRAHWDDRPNPLARFDDVLDRVQGQADGVPIAPRYFGGAGPKGHPLGATGLAQCAELVWQLRGEAGTRQVEGVSLALQHNIGLGGAAVVTLYEQVG